MCSSKMCATAWGIYLKLILYYYDRYYIVSRLFSCHSMFYCKIIHFVAYFCLLYLLNTWYLIINIHYTVLISPAYCQFCTTMNDSVWEFWSCICKCKIMRIFSNTCLWILLLLQKYWFLILFKFSNYVYLINISYKLCKSDKFT